MNKKIPLIVGGAQLGMNYGIANLAGMPSLQQAINILLKAEELGVEFIDTAKAYGKSESVIAEYFAKYPESKMKVFSKINTENDEFEKSCHERFDLFGNRLEGILFHNVSSLSDNNLEIQIKNQSKFNNFGVSVYTPEEFEIALEKEWIKVIQAPFNVWDSKLESLGLLKKAKENKVRVVLRSALLQGALTFDVEQASTKIPFALDYVKKWDKICTDLQKSKNVAALEFAFQAAQDCEFVIGCDNVEQLKNNIEIWNQRDSKIYDEIKRSKPFENIPEIVIRPYLWDSFNQS